MRAIEFFDHDAFVMCRPASDMPPPLRTVLESFTPASWFCV
jgi:hypothetical protein